MGLVSSSRSDLLGLAIAAMASTLPITSPLSSAPGTSDKELKKPFKIRAELRAKYENINV
jgi:hypothetical protein